MTKADDIRLNQRWIIEIERKKKRLYDEIHKFDSDIQVHRKAITELEYGDSEEMDVNE